MGINIYKEIPDIFIYEFDNAQAILLFRQLIHWSWCYSLLQGWFRGDGGEVYLADEREWVNASQLPLWENLPSIANMVWVELSSVAALCNLKHWSLTPSLTQASNNFALGTIHRNVVLSSAESTLPKTLLATLILSCGILSIYRTAVPPF